MVGEYRNSDWRQGDIFVLPDAEQTAGILISHDCDICADLDTEPYIEWIPLALTQEVAGSQALGKNPRTLQVRLNALPQLAVMHAKDKKILGKSDFMERARREARQLLPAELTILRRWLSARYSRSAFPNAFEQSMRKVQGKIDKLSDKKGSGIRALYFDLDDNTMQERIEADGPYELGIYVIYPSETPEVDVIDFRDKLQGIFEEQFFDGKDWKEIQLIDCTHASEDNFPHSLALNTKTWRVDHRSLGGVPSSQLAPEPDR